MVHIKKKITGDNKIRGYILQTIKFLVQCLMYKRKPDTSECLINKQINLTAQVVDSSLL